MHKRALLFIVIIIGLIVGAYFVYFSLPVNIPQINENTALEKQRTSQTPKRPASTNTPSQTTPTASTTPTSRATTTPTVTITTGTTTPNISSIINVSFTDSGFTPTNIKVSKGSKIIFSNDSNRPMWVASDNHPTHELLPELNQGGAGLPGEEYEFIFNKIGTWSYHNHLTPSQKGTIIVE